MRQNWRTDAPRATTIGAPIHLAPLIMAHGTQKMEKIVRIQSFPAYEGLGRTGLHSSPVHVVHLLADRTFKNLKERRTEHFGAPCLFSCQTPIN